MNYIPLFNSQLPHPRTSVRSPRKPNHCLSLTSVKYNILTPRLCGLMVRRWRLIDYFFILYENPLFDAPYSKGRIPRGDANARDGCEG
jgi:hypothetical protein